MTYNVSSGTLSLYTTTTYTISPLYHLHIYMILSLFNHIAALVPLMLSPLLVHLLIPL